MPLLNKELAYTLSIADGRFSGASHGFCTGHVVPEALEGGPIALVEDGDKITIDAASRAITLHVDETTLKQRRSAWQARMDQRQQRQQQRSDQTADGSAKPGHASTASANLRVKRGVLAKYAMLVRDASQGAVTDLF